MKTSDEIRNFCNLCFGKNGFNRDDFDKLRGLADRIDAEMVELPKDKDGEPIRIGDVLFSSANKCHVVSITVKADETYVGVNTDEGVFLPSVNQKHLSRKNPESADSLKRIADEIEAAEDWCDQRGSYGTGIMSVSESTLRDWADRIRKLEEKEGER